MSRTATYRVNCDRCGNKFKVEGELPKEAALTGHVEGIGIKNDFTFQDLCPKCQALMQKFYGKPKKQVKQVEKK